MVKTHRDLQIWQKSMDLVTKDYEEVEHFPDYEKLYEDTREVERMMSSFISTL